MTRPIYVLVFQCSHVGIAMTSLLLHILRKIAPKTSSAFTSEEGRPSCIMHFQAFHQRIYTAARFSATLSSGFHTDCPDYATVGQKTISRQQGHNNGRAISWVRPGAGAVVMRAHCTHFGAPILQFAGVRWLTFSLQVCTHISYFPPWNTHRSADFCNYTTYKPKVARECPAITTHQKRSRLRPDSPH